MDLYELLTETGIIAVASFFFRSRRNWPEQFTNDRIHNKIAKSNNLINGVFY